MNHNKRALIEELRLAGATGIVESNKGAVMCCPFHEDKHASSSVVQGDDGIWRFKCFTCQASGDYYDIKDRNSNLPKGTSYKMDKLPDKPQNSTKSMVTNNHLAGNGCDAIQCSKSKPTQQHIYSLKEIESYGTTYKYTNPKTGVLDLIVVRYDKGHGNKNFRLFSRRDGGYVARGPAVLPLYNRSRVQQSKVVVIVEGEKCVLGLHRAGIVATTKPCGAQAPEKADWSPVYGKEVILWPDNDEPGLKYMAKVKELLTPHCRIKWIDPSKHGLGVKEDAYDWCERNNWDRGECKYPLDVAVDCGASGGVIEYIENVINGTLKEVNFPWPMLTKLTSCLIPGSTTVLVGAGGSGKSMLLMQAVSYWMESGIPWKMYALESTKELHILRALGMRVKDSRMRYMGWIADNPEICRKYYNENKEWMDELGRNIVVPPIGMSHSDIITNLEEDVKTKRVVIIDPISIADKDMGGGASNDYKSDVKYIKKIEKIMKESGSSIINVSHPVKETGCLPDMGNIAGSAAWPNFTHNVLWMQAISPIEVDCKVCFNPSLIESHTINRHLYLLKLRNGDTDAGPKVKIGFYFDRTTVLHELKGMVIKGDKK